MGARRGRKIPKDPVADGNHSTHLCPHQVLTANLHPNLTVAGGGKIPRDPADVITAESCSRAEFASAIAQ